MPRVQQKRGTAANLTAVDPTPLAGELLVVSDENTLIIGNGVDAYTSLAYVTATPRAHTQAWSTITSTPTTLSGYGITDAVESTDARLTDSRTPTDGSVTTAKIADAAVTYAKMQDVSAADRLLGRSSSGAGTVEEITCTAFGRSLIDDADAAAARTTLGAAPAANATLTTPVLSGNVDLRNGGAGDYALDVLSTATTGTLVLRAAQSGLGNNGFVVVGDGSHHTYVMNNSGGNLVYTTTARLGVGTGTPASRLEVNGVITVSAGSAAAPALTISGDSNTGLYQASASANTLSVSTDGTERVRFKATGAVRFIPLSADPGTADAGDVYYNSSTNKLRVYDGSNWVDLH